MLKNQTIDAGESISIPLEPTDPRGRTITFTYTIDSGEWQSVEENTLDITFTEPGMHRVTVFATNGVVQAQTSFTVIVRTPS
jgi:hypothetical protein